MGVGSSRTALLTGLHRTLATAVTLLFATLLVRTAWVCDDAYITLRTVDNLVNGYGLRWNVAERVQSYTDPLWMFLLAGFYALSHEDYFTLLFASISLSVATFVIVLIRLACSWQTAVLGGAVLVFSKAFVEYSTSGLANPLVHLLLALLVLASERNDGPRAAFWVWLSAGLLLSTRLDLAPLIAPLVATRSVAVGWRRALPAALAGLLPFLAWEVFSLVYYGFPFPNTAYAKLQTGVSTEALIVQGLAYLRNSWEADPVTILSTLGLAAGATVGRPSRAWPVVLGVLLHYGYVVSIGGDFMSGRFLTAPLLLTVAVFVSLPAHISARTVVAVTALVAGLGLFATTRPPLLSRPDQILQNPLEEAMRSAGVADERAYYYRETGLLRWRQDAPLPRTPSARLGREQRGEPDVFVFGVVGFLGYFAGPAVHIVDHYGLCDPLLARLPSDPNWRIGHFQRTLPIGYLETLRTGRNQIADPSVARRYEKLRLITRAPLWSRARWLAIAEMNLPRRRERRGPQPRTR